MSDSEMGEWPIDIPSSEPLPDPTWPIPSDEPSLGPEEPLSEEIAVSYSMLIMMALLGATVAMAYLLKKYRFRHVPESLLAISAGALVGLLVRVIPHSLEVRELISFDPSMFFFVLLPPIIFSSGYSMHRGTFFSHLGSIFVFAIVGTIVSAFASGLLIYGVVLLLGVPLSAVSCLAFGALISATDPVTVLSIFHSLNVEPQLFALVFGESVLNDALAIVLFEMLRGFVDRPATADLVMLGIAEALAIFFGSMLVGLVVSCCAALVFKHTRLRDEPLLESSIFMICAYLSYLLAQSVGASGIVSMLFCGIGMAHYASPNLSPDTRKLMRGTFELFAFLAETFTFLYIGVTVMTRDDFVYIPLLVIGTFAAILIARALNVFPLSWFINFCLLRRGSVRRTTDTGCDAAIRRGKIQPRTQIVLWWSGLRGAMAFALAVQLDNPIILTTTLWIVILTVACMGGSTLWLLEKLHVPTGIILKEDGAQEGAHDDAADAGDNAAAAVDSDVTRILGDDDGMPTNISIATAAQQSSGGWFGRLDRRLLLPFLTVAQPAAQAAAGGAGAGGDIDEAAIALLEKNPSDAMSSSTSSTSSSSSSSSAQGRRYEAASLIDFSGDAYGQPPPRKTHADHIA